MPLRRFALQIGVAVSLAAASACAPVYPVALPVNMPQFAVRMPAAGHPDYLTTIHYIDSRVRYADIGTQFFTGPAGEMCYVPWPGKTWCMSPRQIGTVDIDAFVELRCSKWFPYCAHTLASGEFAYPQYADKVQLRELFEDRASVAAALRHLAYLMGGPEMIGDPFALASASRK